MCNNAMKYNHAETIYYKVISNNIIILTLTVTTDWHHIYLYWLLINNWHSMLMTGSKETTSRWIKDFSSWKNTFIGSIASSYSCSTWGSTRIPIILRPRDIRGSEPVRRRTLSRTRLFGSNSKYSLRSASSQWSTVSYKWSGKLALCIIRPSTKHNVLFFYSGTCAEHLQMI